MILIYALEAVAAPGSRGWVFILEEGIHFAQIITVLQKKSRLFYIKFQWFVKILGIQPNTPRRPLAPPLGEDPPSPL